MADPGEGARVEAAEPIDWAYGVFFGVIMAFQFYVRDANPPFVIPLVDPVSRPEGVFLILYFLADWSSARVLALRAAPTPVPFMVRTAFIGFLAITVIAQNGSGLWKTALLFLYAVSVQGYDWVLLWRAVRTPEGGHNVAGWILLCLRSVVAISLVFPCGIGWVGRMDVLRFWDNPASGLDLIAVMCAILLLLKIVRIGQLQRLKFGGR